EKSAIHSWSGPVGASQFRWTRSGCRGAFSSRRVVRVVCRPRTTPARPAMPISRGDLVPPELESLAAGCVPQLAYPVDAPVLPMQGDQAVCQVGVLQLRGGD